MNEKNATKIIINEFNLKNSINKKRLNYNPPIGCKFKNDLLLNEYETKYDYFINDYLPQNKRWMRIFVKCNFNPSLAFLAIAYEDEQFNNHPRYTKIKELFEEILGD